MFIFLYKVTTFHLICFQLLATVWLTDVQSIVFDEEPVNSLHVWITVSSLINKDPNNAKSLLFRQIELNWINAPLEDDNDYIALYLDSQPNDNTLPVSVHRLNGQQNGQVITDYYLPKLDFYNNTADQNLINLDEPLEAVSHGSSSLGIYHHQPNRRSLTQSTLEDQCVGYCLAYHSRHRILASNCLKTSPHWMRDSFRFIGSRALPSLMIPGTHNSATYPKHLDKSALQMINKYQMNQDESIFNQLVFGIRHLDLRVGYSKVKQRSERFWIYHDIFRTEVSMDEVLEQVKRFLELTSHEIVIMDFHRFTVGFQNENAPTQRERHARLIEMIHKQLGQYLIPSYLGLHGPLTEYVSMNKRLIIGYADRASLLGSDQQRFGLMTLSKEQQQARDIDAIKQDQEDSHVTGSPERISGASRNQQPEQVVDNRVGTRLFNKLKAFKLISKSFSKRSTESNHTGRPTSMRLTYSTDDIYEQRSSVDEFPTSKVALFFSPVRHLWPNKDTIEGLAQYMNETTCRKYFGELRSMMAELTPTVFGAISDKYDGNRRLAQLVNRPISDWIRDRWLHCINIVASDYFLGNDLIRLSIYANKMRVLHRNVDLSAEGQCRSFKRVEHLLDKSKIPIQFIHQQPSNRSPNLWHSNRDSSIITHTSSDGNQILLKPLASGYHNQMSSTSSLSSTLAARDKRDSFVENVSDGFTNFVSSFKRLLNL